MALTVTKEKNRVWIRGNTYPYRKELRAFGCHLDHDTRSWWIGAAKESSVTALVSRLNAAPPPEEDLSDTSLLGRVRYTSKTGKVGSWYVVARSTKGGTCRLWLTNLEGTITFWADEAKCDWMKEYALREYGFRGNRQKDHMTLRKIRHFIRENLEAEKDPDVRAVRQRINDLGGRCRCPDPIDEGDGECMVCGYYIVR